MSEIRISISGTLDLIQNSHLDASPPSYLVEELQQ